MIKLESLTNASDASTELILQFPCKLKNHYDALYTKIYVLFFFQIKTHLNQINYKLLIEYNVLKCNLIL